MSFADTQQPSQRWFVVTAPRLAVRASVDVRARVVATLVEGQRVKASAFAVDQEGNQRVRIHFDKGQGLLIRIQHTRFRPPSPVVCSPRQPLNPLLECLPSLLTRELRPCALMLLFSRPSRA